MANITESIQKKDMDTDIINKITITPMNQRA